MFWPVSRVSLTFPKHVGADMFDEEAMKGSNFLYVGFVEG